MRVCKRKTCCFCTHVVDALHCKAKTWTDDTRQCTASVQPVHRFCTVSLHVGLVASTLPCSAFTYLHNLQCTTVLVVCNSSEAASGKVLLLIVIKLSWHKQILIMLGKSSLCQACTSIVSKRDFPLAALLL